MCTIHPQKKIDQIDKSLTPSRNVAKQNEGILEGKATAYTITTVRAGQTETERVGSISLSRCERMYRFRLACLKWSAFSATNFYKFLSDWIFFFKFY